MTTASTTPQKESSSQTNDAKNLYQPGLHDWTERLLSNSSDIHRHSPSFKIALAPICRHMAPLQSFPQWAQYWEDFENHRGRIEPPDEDHLPEGEKRDMMAVPYRHNSIPKIVRKQREIWKEVIDQVNLMIWTCGLWHDDIDTKPALESLVIFRNLLQAPSGLRVDHFNNEYSTTFARLGPCAVVQELQSAIVGSKVCAYYEYQPFDQLQKIIAKYKRSLRKTDANPSRTNDPKKRHRFRYDESIEQQGDALMKPVDEMFAAWKALNEKLDAAPDGEGDDWEQMIEDIHAEMLQLEVEIKPLKEKAHWQYQLIHYVKARISETDTDGIPTPVQNWEDELEKLENAENAEKEKREEREECEKAERKKGEREREERGRRSRSPELTLPTDWQKQSHVPGAVNNIISSLQNLQGLGHRESRRDYVSSFNNDDDDDDTSSICSNDTVRPVSVLSETYQAGSSSHAESSRARSFLDVSSNNLYAGRNYPRPKTKLPISNLTRTFPIDWTSPVSVSDSESSGESEGESESEI